MLNLNLFMDITTTGWDLPQNKRYFVIHCDNQNAIQLASCESYRPRTKHIDIRYHHIVWLAIRRWLSKAFYRQTWQQFKKVPGEQFILLILKGKLDNFSRSLYQQQIEDNAENGNIEAFFAFLHKRCRVSESMEFKQMNHQDEKKPNTKKQKFKHKEQICNWCGKNHATVKWSKANYCVYCAYAQIINLLNAFINRCAQHAARGTTDFCINQTACWKADYHCTNRRIHTIDNCLQLEKECLKRYLFSAYISLG